MNTLTYDLPVYTEESTEKKLTEGINGFNTNTVKFDTYIKYEGFTKRQLVITYTGDITPDEILVLGAYIGHVLCNATWNG
jgi:hypothetical protein